MSFNGISNVFNVNPPDTNGDVSDLHYVQYVNRGWAIFDKNTGLKIDIPGDADDVIPGNAFFSGFGGLCESINGSDPIVLWDKAAQRWLFSQFLGSAAPTPTQCFAISATSDPLGPYHRYAFTFPNVNDYPKIGIWRDKNGARNGYYMVVHEFAGGVFQGAAFVSVDRDRMLVGEPAGFIRFGGYVDAYGAQPPHQEGFELPAQGTCAPFVHLNAETSDYRFWDFCVNWDRPTMSTVSAEQRIAASSPFGVGVSPVEQLGSTRNLDDFEGNVMYRASTRTFAYGGPTETSMVINHAVNAGDGVAGIRWAHLELPNQDEILLVDGAEDRSPALPTVTTEKRLVEDGVYAPTTANRFMGAISIDQNGNIGVGYTRSSADDHPEMMLAARMFNDPPGQLRDEVSCTPAATGSQTGSSRWGDYSSMSVDPVDSCTFWATNEYYATTSTTNWSTRVCSFRFPECGSPDFALVTLEPTRSELCTGDPDPSFSVRAATLSGFSGMVSFSDANTPPSVSIAFDSDTVAAPLGTVFTAVGASLLDDGEYGFDVVGVSGALSHSKPYELGVSTALPPQVELVEPSGGMTDVGVQTALRWSAAERATEYLVEVATDMGFNQIFYSQRTALTSTAPILFSGTTTYYWRVTAFNYCGESLSSEVRSFTTSQPGSCPAGTTTITLLEDEFESGANGWVTQTVQHWHVWEQIAAPPGIGMSTTVWRATNPPIFFPPTSSNTSDQRLLSPMVSIPSANIVAAYVRYDAYHSFEPDPPGCFDGGMLEVSTDGGVSWTQPGDEQLISDPYTGIITRLGVPGWCVAVNGSSVAAAVDLAPWIGESVQLRYRVVTDADVIGEGTPGFFIDNFSLIACEASD